jgi:hypothetical protein
MHYFNYYDEEDLREEGLKPEKWMIDTIKMNNGYSLWDPYEGYMDIDPDSDRWRGRLVLMTWNEFSDWSFDDCNGIVRFYFEIHRKSPKTNKCDLGLALWAIHPRRSSSRGIHIKRIKKEEVQDVIDFLKRADDHNRINFSKLY